MRNVSGVPIWYKHRGKSCFSCESCLSFESIQLRRRLVLINVPRRLSFSLCRSRVLIFNGNTEHVAHASGGKMGLLGNKIWFVTAFDIIESLKQIKWKIKIASFSAFLLISSESRLNIRIWMLNVHFSHYPSLDFLKRLQKKLVLQILSLIR